MRERWCCTMCGAEFVRGALAAHYEAMLKDSAKHTRMTKEQLSIWKRKAGENQLVAGRYQYLFEEAQKLTTAIDNLFVEAYKAMKGGDIKDYIAEELTRFAEKVDKVYKSPTEEQDPE